jgi:hypothetical protein
MQRFAAVKNRKAAGWQAGCKIELGVIPYDPRAGQSPAFVIYQS